MADLYRDFVFTRNTVPVAPGDTAITVEDVSLFPSNMLLAKGDFYVAFESTLTYPHTFEICKLTNVNTATKTLTLVRGQAGTTAQGHSIVTYIKGTLTSDMLKRARAAFAGTTAPTPDADVFLTGDRFYHSGEGRYYAYTGRAGYFIDTFTRAASTTTTGSTESQTYSSLLGATATLPYTTTWNALTGIWGITASNQAYYASGATTTALQFANIGGTDFDISFDVWASTTAGSDYGIFFRGTADGLYGYYLQFNGTTAALYRINAGVFTSTAQTTTYTTGVAHTWRIVANGNNILLYRDGTNTNNYTEVTAGFILASATYLPGANVGMRIGNATGLADTTLYWDNFSATYPGNTALNTPALQGWAPTSATVAESLAPINLTKSLETVVPTLASQIDDILGAVAYPESVATSQGRAIAAVTSNVDDIVDVLSTIEGRGQPLSAAVAQTAAQVDEILDALTAGATQQGVGDPSSTAIAGVTYVDTFSKRLWIYSGSAWVPITYSGPSPGVAVMSARGVSSANSVTVTLPAGTIAGDLAVMGQVQRNNGPAQIGTPAGWMMVQGGYGPDNYWSACAVFTKTITAADITAGSVTMAGSVEDACILRTYAFATVDISGMLPGNAGYTMVQTSNGYVATPPAITTTRANDIVVQFYFNVGNSPTFSSPSGSLVNTRQVVGTTVAIYSGEETQAAAGASTTRSITANGGSIEVGAIDVALKSAAPAPLYAPGALTGTGAPTGGAVAGTLYVDTATTIVYFWTGSAWISVSGASGTYMPETVATANSGTVYTIADPTTASITNLTMTGNAVFTFPTAGAGKSFTLALTQDATGSRTATWPGTVKWPGAATPSLSTASGKTDLFTFVCIDGTNWLGSLGGRF